jgi:peptidoglycan/LPS O-acetylase OafA/YrhL
LVSGFSRYLGERRRLLVGRPSTLAGFFRRRAWRIGPPYYVALAIAATWWWAWPAARAPLGTVLDPTAPSPEGVGAHLLLAHHLDPAWINQLNPPLWSIPYEVQLYGLFPLLFLLATRLPAILGFAIALASFLAAREAGLVGHLNFFEAFLGGMAMAHLASTGPRPLAQAGAAAGLAALAYAYWQGPATYGYAWVVGFMGLLLACHLAAHHPANPFTTRPLRALGACSYSLYIIHFPVVYTVAVAVHATGWPHLAQLAAMLAGGGALSLLAAAAMYRWVERPSIARMRG